MLALCLMLSATYYAQNYAGINGVSLAVEEACNALAWVHANTIPHCITILEDHIRRDAKNFGQIDGEKRPCYASNAR